MSPRGRSIRTTLITALSIVIGVPVVGIIVIMALLGQFRDNVAADAAKPIGSAMDSLHGRQVCDAGDAGYSPDNTQPWYQTFYEVKDTPGIAGTVTAAAKKQGYVLERQTSLEGGHAPSELWKVTRSGRTVEIDIYRGRDAISSCNAGPTTRAAKGNAVVFVAVTFPYRDAS